MSPRERKPGSSRTTRLRKVHCSECGYVVRMSRKWIEIALPDCPNPDCAARGFAMTCPEPADQVIADPALLESLPRPVRTAVCRENGWEQNIIRTQVPEAERVAGRRVKRALVLAADLPF